MIARLKSGVVVLGRSDEGKASLIVRVSGDLTEKVKAGNVIKELVPILGGKGGGRPDNAQGITRKLRNHSKSTPCALKAFIHRML